MWNEHKAERYEELRKRQDRLSRSERAELAELSQELEGIDSSFVTEADEAKRQKRVGHELTGKEKLEQPRLDLVQRVGGLAAAVVSLAAGGVAAVGALLMWFGVSPGRISKREPGVDFIENHVMFFGPFVLLSWGAFLFARPKSRFAFCAVLFTISWFLGFCAIK